MFKLKSLLIVLTVSILLSGCMNNNTEDQNKENDSISIEQKNTAPDSASISETPLVPLPYIVNYDESTGRFEIDKNPAAETVAFTSEQLAFALKNKYPEIDLRVGERKRDTLELHIDDATYLTQNIGSAGANNYLAEATYAFTSLDSVKVVNFIFEPGDHAMPGSYDRKYFDDYH